MNTDITENFY